MANSEFTTISAAVRIMRPYSIDEHWERLVLRYEERGQRVPPHWLRFYRSVLRVIAWGASR